MTYKIISTTQLGATLITTVEYNFDGEILIVDVSHFMPDSLQKIEENIVDRAQSEMARIQSEQNIAFLLPQIELNEEKSIE
jgi:hypothetical protein